MLARLLYLFHRVFSIKLLQSVNYIVCIYQNEIATASNPKYSTKKYRRSICGKAFDSDEILNSHMNMEHSQKSHAPAGVG
jgi:hypothetical protein